MLDALPRSSPEFARLLETRDDAAVTRISDDLCLVQTVDFFTPIVDSAYWFGQLAAANALSDVYAMGATPLTAMNLVAWPSDLDMGLLAELLKGGAEKVIEAGADLAGGHSIDDKEPKYGLAVTGVARPEDIVYNGGAQTGDLLVLTKRLGIGVLASALKKGLITEDEMMPAIEEAAGLNADAARAMAEVGVHACTDVTGFGLHRPPRRDARRLGCGGRGGRSGGTAARRRARADRAGGLRGRPAQQPRLPRAPAAGVGAVAGHRRLRRSVRRAGHGPGSARARTLRPADLGRAAHGRARRAPPGSARGSRRPARARPGPSAASLRARPAPSRCACDVAGSGAPRRARS